MTDHHNPHSKEKVGYNVRLIYIHMYTCIYKIFLAIFTELIYNIMLNVFLAPVLPNYLNSYVTEEAYLPPGSAYHRRMISINVPSK